MGFKSSARSRAATRTVSNNSVASSSVRSQSDRSKSHTMHSPDLDDLREARSSYYSRPAHERIKEMKCGADTKDKSDDRSSVTTSESKRQRKPRARRDQHGHSDSVSVYPGRSRNVSSRRKEAMPEVPLRQRKTLSQHHVDRRRGEKQEDRSTRRPVPQRSRATPVPKAKAPHVTVVSIESRHSSASSTSSKTNRRTSGIFGTFFRTKSANAVPSIRLVECLTCGSDEIPSSKSAKMGCGHRMCHECLKRLFTLSTTDPAHMPPKCCTADHIPLEHVESLFNDKFKILWNKKYQEYTTNNRLYCPTRDCGTWIPPKYIRRSSTHDRKYGTCPRCGTKVCFRCNNKWHRSSPCTSDAATRAFIATAKEKGWQPCYSCHAMVELKEGCNHMTCLCTAEFCMLCGVKWKGCPCPWFNFGADEDQSEHMRAPHDLNADAPPRPQRTYNEELEARRRQERLDEILARRMQINTTLAEPHTRDVDSRAQDYVWGVGNGGSHRLNDDFVNNNAEPVTRLGDTSAGYGRRGERESGRRKPRTLGLSLDAGLPANAFGEASVLGIAPYRTPESVVPKEAAPRKKSGRGIGGWLSRLR